MQPLLTSEVPTISNTKRRLNPATDMAMTGGRYHVNQAEQTIIAITTVREKRTT